MKKGDQSEVAPRPAKKLVFINYQELYKKSLLEIETLKNEKEELRKENSQLKGSLSDQLRRNPNNQSVEAPDLEDQSQASTDTQKVLETSDLMNHSTSFSSLLVPNDRLSEEVGTIVDNQDIDTQDVVAELFSAVEKGNVDIVKTLLDSPKLTQEDLCRVNSNGDTVIDCAARTGQTEVVIALLESFKFTQEAFCHVNRERYTALMIAVQNGHNKTVNALLGSDKLPYEIVESAFTLAVHFELIEFVKVLLKSDKLTPQAFCENNYGEEVLHIAYMKTCREMDVKLPREILKILLESDKLSTEDLLNWVTRLDDLDILSQLLESSRVTEEIISRASQNGYANLMSAVENDRTLTVHLFLRWLTREALCRVNQDGDTLLMIAAQRGWHKIVDDLQASEKLSHVELAQVNKKGESALIIAVKNGHTEVVKVLLSSVKLTQEAVCYFNQYGDNALHLAAKAGHSEIVKVLADSVKFPPEAFCQVNKEGSTALMLAAESGCTEVVKALLASDKLTQEAVCCTDQYRYTALVLAAEYGHTEVVKVLLDSVKLTQEAVCLINMHGDTAFFTAVKKGHTETVKALLTSDKLTQEVVSYVTVDDKTALMIAAESGHTEIFIAVLGSDKFTHEAPHGSFALKEAGQRGHTKMVKALLESDKLTQEAACFVSEFDETALMASARRGNTDGELVKLLLESDKLTQKAVCYVNKEGQNALMIACETASPEVVKVLLDSIKLTQEAVCQVNKDGGTALTIAIEAGNTLRYRIETGTLEALLASDKFTEEAAWSVNKDGETALMIAVKKNDIEGGAEAIRALLESPKYSAKAFGNVVCKGKIQKFNKPAIFPQLNTRIKECLTVLCETLEISKIKVHRFRIYEWLKLHSDQITGLEYFPGLLVRALIKLIKSDPNDEVIDELLTAFDLKRLFPLEKASGFQFWRQNTYNTEFAENYCNLIGKGMMNLEVNSQLIYDWEKRQKIIAEITVLLPDYMKTQKPIDLDEKQTLLDNSLKKQGATSASLDM